MRSALLVTLIACAMLSGCGGESGPSGPRAILGAVAVSAGAATSCALGGAGSMVCWGAVPPGAASDTTVGLAISRGAVSVPLPEPFTSINLSKNQFVPTGCSVSESAKVYCWGDLLVNIDGALSLGTGITALAGATSAGSVSVGTGHLCVARTDRAVRCFGEYTGGGRGTDSVALSPAPAPDLVPTGLSPTLAAFGTAQGDMFGCALRTDSLVACWGLRSRGRLGGVSADTLTDCGTLTPETCQPGPAVVAGGAKYRQLATGFATACATRISGEIDCWGTRPGAGSCDVMADCPMVPTLVPLPGAALRVVVGVAHACALLSNGAAYCWGKNDQGQLGRPGADSPAPVPVAGGYVFTTLSAGVDHTCGLELGTGAVGCWGANWAGQLGDGTLVNRDHPVAVVAAQ